MNLPYSPGPEKSVLSSMLKDEQMFAVGRAEGITAEHFYEAGSNALFTAMQVRTKEGGSLELVSFVDWLHKAGRLESVGGPGAVTDIYTYAPNNAHFSGHIAILRESLARRRAIAAAASIANDGDDLTAEDLAKRLRKATEATQAALSADNGLIDAKEAVRRLTAFMEACHANGDLPGHPTGLEPVDIVTGGMRKGDLWVIAGPPAGGKSVAMLQAACEFLKAGKRVLVVSLEMQAETVLARMVSCMHRLPFRHLMFPKEATHHTLVTARRVLKDFSELPLVIHDKGGLDIDRITGLTRAVSDTGGLDLLVVDYLQLIEGRGNRREESRQEEVAGVSRGLKNLAKQLGIPVLTGSQLNDKGYLRESRAIGQDADVVLAIDEDGIEGRKVRNGATGQMFPLKLNGEFQRFERA